MSKKQNLNAESETEAEVNDDNLFTPVTTEEIYSRVDESSSLKIKAGDTVKGIFYGFFEREGFDERGNPIGENWLNIGMKVAERDGTTMFRCSPGLKNALKRSEVREMDEIQIHREGASLTDTVWTINKILRG